MIMSRTVPYRNQHSVSSIWSLVVLAIGCLLYYIVYLNSHKLPDGLRRYEGDGLSFNAERARSSLRNLTSFGQRVVGDYVNEELVPRFLEDEFNHAKTNAHPTQSLILEKDRGSGAYHLGFAIPFTNIYDQVQNVMVMLEGYEGRHSILINCHYDTVYETEGATDDGISCAVMLEIMRVLSQSPKRLRHNIVFLFNGAEEVPLQGSHLFTKHPWSNNTRMFMNLEGGGSGGPSIMFQAGPDHPWLLKYYEKYAPHPHCFVMIEEMFQSGLIPSDTDFRIFRDYANIPGLDMTFYHNTFVYHTVYDQEVYIPIGSYQHMGDNVLAMLRGFGDAVELTDMQNQPSGKMVYFDYLGWFMISYSSEAGIGINLTMIAMLGCSIAVFFGRLLNWKWLPFSHAVDQSSDLNKRIVFIEFGWAVLVRLLSMACVFAAAAIIGAIIDAAAVLTMPWYSNVWLIFPMYWCPCLMAYSVLPYLINKWRRKHVRIDLTPSAVSQINLTAVQTTWMLIVFVLTCMNIRSAFIFVIQLVFWTVSNFIMYLTPLYLVARRWTWAYLLIQIPAVLWNFYVTLIVYVLFIPIMARSGKINSDLYIAIITAVLCIITTSFMVPLASIVRRFRVILGLIFGFMIVTIIVALTTSIGHPYDGRVTSPHPQRYWIMHTYREYHDVRHEIRHAESGYFVLNLDKNSPITIPTRMRENMRSLANDCDEEPYCGLPLYMTRMVPLSPQSTWIPAGMPILPYKTDLSSDKTCVNSTCTISLILNGPDRLTLTLVPKPGIELEDWSIPTPVEVSGKWKDRPTYYLHIVRGKLNPVDPFYTLSLKFKVPETMHTSPIVDVGLAGNHVHHVKDRTPDFQAFLDSLPDFTTKMGWISSYKSYIL